MKPPSRATVPFLAALCLLPGSPATTSAQTGAGDSNMWDVPRSGGESVASYIAMSEYTGAKIKAAGCKLNRLPVVEKWVYRDGTGADSLLRRYEYGRFRCGTDTLTRPTRVYITTCDTEEQSRHTIYNRHYRAYDSRGRITAMTDADGRRISATWDSTLSFAHYADGIRKQTIWTREVKGVTKKEFRTYEDAYEFSSRDVGNINNVLFLHMPWGYISSMDIHVYMQDYQGNNRAAVEQTRWAVQTTDYYPYGAPMATSTGANVNPYKYSGKEHETRKGLNQYDFHARNQLPTLGLFDQPDPKAGDYPWLNPYLYCAANPIANIDPTGNWSIKVSASEDRDANDRILHS